MQTPSHQTPRNPLLAATMSLVLPGFGQLYNGEVNKAIYLFLCFALLSVPGVAAVALYLPSSLTVVFIALGLVATLGVWLYGIVQAWRQAKNSDGFAIQNGIFFFCFKLNLKRLWDAVYFRVSNWTRYFHRLCKFNLQVFLRASN